MRLSAGIPLLSMLLLAGCSGGGLSTSSIFGGSSPPADAAAQAAAPLPPPSTPTERAFQVGVVSARAVKCGYNFDSGKLKANYLASETSLGASPQDMANIEKTYTVAFNGVTKAAAGEPNYCSESKTREIKADLTRLLAGDFTPPVKKAEAQDGLFSGWFDGSSGSSEGLNQKPSTYNEY